MAQQRGNMLVPAVIGGLVSGVLSAVPLANCFCCLWIILGAVLATYIYFREPSVLAASTDGLLIGILVGLIATIIDFFLSIPFQALNLAFARRFLETLSQFTEEIPAGWESWLEKSRLSVLSLPLIIFTLTLRAIIFAGLGALGGVIGMSLFGRKKRTQAAASPSPPATPPSSLSS